jgi:hypothetical protein
MSTNDASDLLRPVEARHEAPRLDSRSSVVDQRWFLIGVFCGLAVICAGFWAALAAMIASTV